MHTNFLLKRMVSNVVGLEWDCIFYAHKLPGTNTAVSQWATLPEVKIYLQVGPGTYIIAMCPLSELAMVSAFLAQQFKIKSTEFYFLLKPHPSPNLMMNNLLSTFYTVGRALLITQQVKYYYPHFTNNKTEVQVDNLT